jgi:hypothetical protein
LISYEAGQATITLINQDGRFDPDNFQGPYQQQSGWSFSVTGTPSDGTFFILPTANALQVYVGDWVQFSDVAGNYKVTAISAPSGGNCNISITPTAPGVISSGTASRYETMVTPQVKVAIRAEYGGISYPLWSGFAVDWEPQYNGPAHSYCVLTATDGLGYLAQDELRTELGSPTGAGELSGDRINRILDSASWPTGPGARNVDTGTVALQGTTLGGPPLEELQATADAELGAIYVTGDGQFRFTSRQAILNNPDSADSQATFGSGPGELPYIDRELEHQSTRLVNTIIYGIRNGTSHTLTDSGSVTRYLSRPYSNTDLLLTSDDDALQWASLILYQNKDPEQWFNSVTIDPRPIPDTLFPLILNSEIGDRETIRRRPPGMPAISRDCFIRGISHEYRTGYWRTQWVLQSAEKYNFFILGTGILGHDRLA